jgi:cupin fold WbuC family metalloprotein
MQIIDDTLLDQLTEKARTSPRQRANFNLHGSYDDPCQRLLNAVEPGSYVRPHRHLDPPRPETFVAVRGRLAVVVFTADGALLQVVPLAIGTGTIGVDLPAGTWHSVLALETGSIFFETKPGPYQPLSDKDFAIWAPAEGSAEAADYLRKLEKDVRIFLAHA